MRAGRTGVGLMKASEDRLLRCGPLDWLLGAAGCAAAVSTRLLLMYLETRY